MSSPYGLEATWLGGQQQGFTSTASMRIAIDERTREIRDSLTKRLRAMNGYTWGVSSVVPRTEVLRHHRQHQVARGKNGRLSKPRRLLKVPIPLLVPRRYDDSPVYGDQRNCGGKMATEAMHAAAKAPIRPWTRHFHQQQYHHKACRTRKGAGYLENIAGRDHRIGLRNPGLKLTETSL